MSHARYLVGDVFERMAELEDGSVDLILTSPPFLALRSYLPDDHPDKAKEIGSEPTPAEFIDTMLALTAEWRRILAPHGTLAVELGDTYSGSGGAGGDYLQGGWREGQRPFDGSSKHARIHDPDKGPPIQNKDGRTQGGGIGWPLAKSLTLIPEAYRFALAYGFNPHTRQDSPAGQWRIRNVIRWVRPNPPVGALGDKFRPATSEMVVACVSDKRWFDLDAVREPPNSANQRQSTVHRMDIPGRTDQVMNPTGPDGMRILSNPAGAPPLDWWKISPGGYKGSHYAVFPPELCVKPIKAMCPERVCRTCGEPSRRIVGDVGYVNSKTGAPVTTLHFNSERRKAGENHWDSEGQGDRAATRVVPTVGWTHCGCGDGCRSSTWKVDVVEVTQGRVGRGKWIDLDEWDEEDEDPTETRVKRKRKRIIDDLGDCFDPSHWRPGVVLDPFAGSGTTLMVATGHGRDAIGIDIDERNATLAEERLGGLFLTVERKD